EGEHGAHRAREPAPPSRQAARVDPGVRDPRSRAGRFLEVPLGRRSAAVRVQRGAQALGRGAPRLHPPARRVHSVPREGPWQGALLPLRPGAERVRDRWRVHPGARPRGAGEGLRRHGDLAGGGGAEVRFLAPGAAVRRSAPWRYRAGDGPSRVPAHRSGVAARRDPVPEDAKGDRSDDRCPWRCRSGSAARAAHRRHPQAAGVNAARLFAWTAVMVVAAFVVPQGAPLLGMAIAGRVWNGLRLTLPFLSQTGDVIAGAVGGVVVGFFQWLVLKNDRARWLG